MFILEGTPEEIQHHYVAMGHSVKLINAIIDGNQMVDEDEVEKIDCVRRNVEHLKIMLAQDFWTDEDMTEVNSAISAGETYIAT